MTKKYALVPCPECHSLTPNGAHCTHCSAVIPKHEAVIKSVICGKCEQAVAGGGKYCSSCGSILEEKQ